MAIFGPKDRNISALTQFYQLSFDPKNPIDSELDEWLFLIKQGIIGDWERYQFDMSHARARKASHYREEWKTEVLHAASVYPLAHRLMDIMADGEDAVFETPGDKVGYGFKTREPQIINGKEMPQDPLDLDLLKQQDEYEIWDTSNFVFDDCLKLLNRKSSFLRPWLYGVNPRHPAYDRDKPAFVVYGNAMNTPEIDGALLGELMDATARGRKAFRRCPTCDSVFIVGRADQMRCSKRCNDRVGNHRRYEKIKIAKLGKQAITA